MIDKMVMMFVEPAQQDVIIGEPGDLELGPFAHGAFPAGPGARPGLAEIELVGTELLEKPKRQTAPPAVPRSGQAMALHLLVGHCGKIGKLDGEALHGLK
jgi:hypothetical protein